ncbi:hypothetical protein Mgra_00005393 [Meloidogyne graminicola]|uniref:Uncharacterized protein n=1 Tax=Meloidogyne graminicola TaxID=189291 RepID=A0A8S9ZPH5_9BILA|nr:hypothetical protein Mgra_00005393 [Meloidogyne graminicola]
MENTLFFGRLVGGATTLCAIENVKTDKEDRPLEDVRFMAAEVFVDPFEEAAEKVRQERKALSIQESSALNEQSSLKTNRFKKPKTYSSGVGKYIKPDIRIAVRRAAQIDNEAAIETKKQALELC